MPMLNFRQTDIKSKKIYVLISHRWQDFLTSFRLVYLIIIISPVRCYVWNWNKIISPSTPPKRTTTEVLGLDFRSTHLWLPHIKIIKAKASRALSILNSPWAIVKIGIFRYNLTGHSPTWRDVRRRYIRRMIDDRSSGSIVIDFFLN